MKEPRLNHILNVIDRFSDKDFQRKCWVDTYDESIVTSFPEGVNILDDFDFFEILESTEFLKKHGLSNDLTEKLKVYAKKILHHKDMNLRSDILLETESWNSIVNESKEIIDQLKEELNIKDDYYFI